jgi:hypothetical protein
MSPAQEALNAAAVAGVEVYLNEAGSPVLKGNPNRALMMALKENKAEIVKILGGKPEPEFCDMCNAWIFEAVDSENFCRVVQTRTTPGCPFRQRVRGR